MNSRILPAIALIWCLLSLAIQASASHPANQLPDVYHQLASVNKQWWKIDVPAHLKAPAKQFTSDTRLIQEHLKYTEQYLRSRDSQGLTAEQINNRLHSLDVLNAYWKEGHFPQNYDFPVRIPYFIDAHNTACAVGYLIIESGHGDIAEMIRKNSNNAYLLDMNYPELTAWVAQSGFTAQELALIQPGYLPATEWDSYGTGTDGVVNTVTPSADGTKLYVGGSFTEINGTSASSIGYLDGSGWHGMGAGLNGTVFAITEFDGSLFAGGAFTDSAGIDISPVMEWNGTAWVESGGAVSPYGIVYTFQEYNGLLYIGGDYELPTGALRENLAWYDGTNLMGDTDCPNGPVYALTVFGGKLIVAGGFSTAGLGAYDNIAAFDGTTWAPLGAGVHTTAIRALEEKDGKLYIGGDFAVNGTDTLMGYGYWNDTTWTDLSSLMGSVDWTDTLMPPLPYTIYDLWADTADMFIAGDVGTSAMQMFHGYGLLSGDDNVIRGYAQLDDAARSLAIYQGDLVIGGEFDTVITSISNLTNVGGIIYTNKSISNGISYNGKVNARIYPNPTSGQAILELDGAGELQQLVLVIYEVSGKAVKSVDCNGQGKTIIDCHDLSAGMYLYQLEDKNGVHSRGRIVIQ